MTKQDFIDLLKRKFSSLIMILIPAFVIMLVIGALIWGLGYMIPEEWTAKISFYINNPSELRKLGEGSEWLFIAIQGIRGRIHIRLLERLGTHHTRPRNREPDCYGTFEASGNFASPENRSRINHTAFRQRGVRRRVHDVLHDILAARVARRCCVLSCGTDETQAPSAVVGVPSWTRSGNGGSVAHGCRFCWRIDAVG